MKIAVSGAGAWGTALAVQASQGAAAHRVSLWARDSAHAQNVAKGPCQCALFARVGLPVRLAHCARWRGRVDGFACRQNLVVLAAPMSGLRGLLERLKDLACPVAWLCKGFEVPSADLGGFGRMGHEVQQSVAPQLRAGVLSGPSFAQEVARGQPTALVAASQHATVRDSLVHAFHGRGLRVYATDDVVGVEVGGAVKMCSQLPPDCAMAWRWGSTPALR